MTSAEAEAFLGARGPGACIGYLVNARGEVEFRDVPAEPMSGAS
jgi:hypothetical protein